MNLFHPQYTEWPDSIFFEFIQYLHMRRYAFSTIGVYGHKIRIFGKILQSYGYDESNNNILIDFDIFKKTLYRYHYELLKKKTSNLQAVSSLNQYIMSWNNFRSWFCLKTNLKATTLKISYFKLPDSKPELLQMKHFSLYLPNDDVDYIQLKSWCIFDLLCHAGLRVIEIIKLQLRNFVPEKQSLILDTRFKQSRIVYLDSVTTTYLEKYLKLYCDHFEMTTLNPKFPMFTMTNGAAVTYKSVRKIVSEFAAAVFSKKVTPKILRSSCVFHYLTESNDTRAVQELMGYLSLNSVLKYTRYDITPLREELKKALLRFHWNPKDTF